MHSQLPWSWNLDLWPYWNQLYELNAGSWLLYMWFNASYVGAVVIFPKATNLCMYSPCISMAKVVCRKWLWGNGLTSFWVLVPVTSSGHSLAVFVFASSLNLYWNSSFSLSSLSAINIFNLCLDFWNGERIILERNLKRSWNLLCHLVPLKLEKKNVTCSTAFYSSLLLCSTMLPCSVCALNDSGLGDTLLFTPGTYIVYSQSSVFWFHWSIQFQWWWIRAVDLCD